jgi:hypothetical protein
VDFVTAYDRNVGARVTMGSSKGPAFCAKCNLMIQQKENRKSNKEEAKGRGGRSERHLL